MDFLKDTPMSCLPSHWTRPGCLDNTQSGVQVTGEGSGALVFLMPSEWPYQEPYVAAFSPVKLRGPSLLCPQLCCWALLILVHRGKHTGPQLLSSTQPPASPCKWAPTVPTFLSRPGLPPPHARSPAPSGPLPLHSTLEAILFHGVCVPSTA